MQVPTKIKNLTDSELLEAISQSDYTNNVEWIDALFAEYDIRYNKQ